MHTPEEIQNEDHTTWNVTHTIQPYEVGTTPEIYTLLDYVEQFTKPCGRFLSPLSWRERLKLRLAKEVSRFPFFTHIEIISNYSLPGNWHILLTYLYQKKIIAAPSFSSSWRRNDSPVYPSFKLIGAFDPTRSDGNPVTILGQGIDFSPEVARLKAVGELIERYMLTQYRQKDLTVATYDEMKKKGANPLGIDQLNGYLPEQHSRYNDFKERTEYSRYAWSPAENLTTGKKAAIPTQLIYWNYNLYSSQSFEPRLQHNTTSGSAGHCTVEEATISALHELIERDAFCVYWLNTLSPKQLLINPEELVDHNLRELIIRTKKMGVEIYFLDTTSDIAVPCCVCVTIDKRGGKPIISLGASSGYDIEDNLLSALFESLSVNQYTASQKEYVLPHDYQTFGQNNGPISREHRLALWQSTEMFEQFRFFIEGETVPLRTSRFAQLAQTFETPGEELASLLALFEAKGVGYEVYRYEVRHEVLETLGYHVVRVVVPKLFPIYLVEHFATLDSDRLRAAPALLGHTTSTENPWPHPFP